MGIQKRTKTVRFCFFTQSNLLLFYETCLPPTLSSLTTLPSSKIERPDYTTFPPRLTSLLFNFPRRHSQKDRYVTKVLKFHHINRATICWVGVVLTFQDDIHQRIGMSQKFWHHINRATIYWMIYVADRLKFKATTILLPYVFTLRFPLSSQYEPIYNHRKKFRIYFEDWREES